MKRSTTGTKRQRLKRLLLSTTIGSGLLLSVPACNLPQLQKPTAGAAMPDSFNGRMDQENSACMDLHQFFNDPLLTGLIDQAMFDNQELKILAQDIRIANNEVLARSGAYLPFLSFGAGAGIDKPGRFTRAGAVEDQLQIRPGHGFPEPLPDFMVATNVSWEIDIWKRLRNAQRAAALRYLGTAEGRNYTVTRLVAEIAENYYTLLALDKRLETLDKTISLQEQSLEKAKFKKASGADTELGVQRFQAEVRKNQSEKLIVQQRIVETENRINFLVGRYPQVVERQKIDFFSLTVQTLSIGIPAQLLQNRPDIRQAERELQSAGLEVQVARARFYPSLVLSAGVGYRAFNPKYLFTTPDSLIYNAAGDIVAPLVNRRAIKAEYLNANARQLQAVYDYQRTVLNAFTEVINNISKVENYGRSLDIKRQQLESLEASVDAATKLYQAARPGVDYVDVLLAQRDLQDAKVVVIETKQEQLSAIVATYQALGGGLIRNSNAGAPLFGAFVIPEEEVVPGADSAGNDAANADKTDADKADADKAKTDKDGANKTDADKADADKANADKTDTDNEKSSSDKTGADAADKSATPANPGNTNPPSDVNSPVKDAPVKAAPGELNTLQLK